LCLGAIAQQACIGIGWAIRTGRLGSALSSGSYEQPAKLGTITFVGGTSCIGLLRRVSCN